MAKLKKLILVPLLVLWGISAVSVALPLVTSSDATTVNAQAADFTVTATKKTDTSAEISITFDATKYPTAKVFKFFRQPETGANVVLESTTNKSVTDNSPGTGSVRYYVNAHASLPDALSDINLLASGISSPIVFGSSSTSPSTPTAGAATSDIGGECSDAVSNATARGQEQVRKLENNKFTLFQTINTDGVKKVFRWSLSLVNLLTLIFLLIITLANVLRIDVDTYSVKKVFIPLLFGVILANFSWLISRFFIELATILYTAIVSGPGASVSSTDPGTAGAAFFEAIVTKGYGLTDLCSIATGTGSAAIAEGLLGAIAGTVLVLIAGILILTLYILLVARVWIVTLLIVVAPLAFLSLGFPLTKSYFKRWWTLFFNWVFMAPAAFLILRLAEVAGSIGSGPNLTRYIIVTALLYYAVQVPFKMGGDWMTKWGGYVSQFKQRLGNPVKDVAESAVKATGADLKNRAIYGLYKNPVGDKVSQFQAHIRTNRDRRATDAEWAAKGRGEARYAETDTGKNALTKLGRATTRTKTAEDAIKTAKEEGVERFERSGTREAEGLKAKQAELRKREETVQAELKHTASAADLRFTETEQWQQLQTRLTELARDEELEHEKMETAVQAAEFVWQKSHEASKLEHEIEEARQIHKKTENDLKELRTGQRNIYRGQDLKKEEARTQLAYEVGRLTQEAQEEREKGTGTSEEKIAELEQKREREKAAGAERRELVREQLREEEEKIKAAGAEEYVKLSDEKDALDTSAKLRIEQIELQLIAERNKGDARDKNKITQLEQLRSQEIERRNREQDEMEIKVKQAADTAKRGGVDPEVYKRLKQRMQEEVLLQKTLEQKIIDDIAKERRKGTGTNPERLKQLQKELAEKEKALTAAGSLAVTATLSEKWAQVAEARLAQYDKQSSPEASKRAFADDFATAAAQKEYDKIHRQYGTVEKNLSEAEDNLKKNPLFRNVLEEIELTRKDIENQVKNAPENQDKSPIEIEKIIVETIKKQSETEGSKLYTLTERKESFDTEPMKEWRSDQKRLDRALIKSEQVLHKKQQVSAENTAEVVAELVSSMDSEKEDLSYILARASENPSDTALMNVVNSKRAQWRTYIKRNEQIVESFLEQAFADMVRLDWKKIATRVGTNINNNPMTVRDVEKLSEDYAWRNIQAGMAKDLVAGETKKAEVRIALQMKSPQEYLDQIKLLGNTIKELENNLRFKTEKLKTLSGAEYTDMDKQVKRDRWLIKSKQDKLETQERELRHLVDDVKKATDNQWDLMPDYMKRYFKRESTRDAQGNVIQTNRIVGVYDAQQITGGRKVNYDRIIGIAGPDADSRETGYLNNKSMLQLSQDAYGRGDDTYLREVFQKLFTQEGQSIARLMRESDEYNHRFDVRDIHKPAAVLGALLRKARVRRDADALMARQILFDAAPDKIIESTLAELDRDPAFQKLVEKKTGVSVQLQALADTAMEASLAGNNDQLTETIKQARGLLATNEDQEISVFLAGLTRGMEYMHSARLARGTQLQNA